MRPAATALTRDNGKEYLYAAFAFCRGGARWVMVGDQRRFCEPQPDPGATRGRNLVSLSGMIRCPKRRPGAPLPSARYAGRGGVFSLGKDRNPLLFLTRCPADDPAADIRVG